MSENLASDTDDSAGNTALLTERNTLSTRVKDLEKQLADTRISSVYMTLFLHSFSAQKVIDLVLFPKWELFQNSITG